MIKREEKNYSSTQVGDISNRTYCCIKRFSVSAANDDIRFSVQETQTQCDKRPPI